MDMIKALHNETNVTHTENGAVARKTTNTYVLDLFAQIGAMRNRDERDIYGMFDKAFCEDPLLAMRTLFYSRDIRGGQGERRTFRIILKELCRRHPKVVRKNIELIPEFGRWDDLYELFDTSLEKAAGDLIAKQFLADMTSETPSLLGKWLKSENTSSKESRRLATKTRKILDLTSKAYRKSLSKLRKQINIVESKMSSKEWSTIEYDKLPSKAGLQYRKAFFRNDEERYKAFLDSLENGEVKVNSSTLFPYELVSKASRDSIYNRLPRQEVTLLDGMWKALPNYIGDKEEDSIAVVDVSGSMNGLPMEVAVSVGLYLAERNKGRFHNKFITFESKPQLVDVVGTTIVDKVNNMKSASWGGSTNLEATFDLILNMAVKYKMPQSEIPRKLYIISDMEFDSATDPSYYGYGCRYNNKPSVNKTLMNKIADKYKAAGYEMPNLVFWNVNARNSQFPMSMDDRGFQLVSGCSPSIFEATMKGEFLSAYDLMLNVINAERYHCVTV